MLQKKQLKIYKKKIIPINKIICEPKLDKRNLYSTLGTKSKERMMEPRKIINFLMYSNGRYSINKISQVTNIKLEESLRIYKLLKSRKVIE